MGIEVLVTAATMFASCFHTVGSIKSLSLRDKPVIKDSRAFKKDNKEHYGSDDIVWLFLYRPS